MSGYQNEIKALEDATTRANGRFMQLLRVVEQNVTHEQALHIAATYLIGSLIKANISNPPQYAKHVGLDKFVPDLLRGLHLSSEELGAELDKVWADQ